TRRLAGEAAALGAGAMCSLFGAFAWFAWSGMETMALAWLLLRAARVAAARCEPGQGEQPPPVWELSLLGGITPPVRPEGALASLMVAAALVHPASRARAPHASHPGRAWALLPLVGPLVAPALNLIFAGHAASSTTQVKWLLGNPYYDAGTIASASLAN